MLKRFTLFRSVETKKIPFHIIIHLKSCYMKKIFTFFTAALLAMSVSAQVNSTRVELSPLYADADIPTSPSPTTARRAMRRSIVLETPPERETLVKYRS